MVHVQRTRQLFSKGANFPQQTMGTTENRFAPELNEKSLDF